MHSVCAQAYGYVGVPMHICVSVWSPEAGMGCLSLLSAPSVWMQGLLLNPELTELV